KGKFWPIEDVPISERSTSRFPLILTTGRILTQYNVGAQTRRTNNVVWHTEDLLEIHPHDAEVRGISDGDWVGLTSRAGETVLRAKVSEKIAPGVVYTTFHFPETNANVVTTENSDWATNCPEYKVTAVEVVLVYHDVPHVVMLATPADLEDYAVGFTLSEGLVARAEEIRGVEVSYGALSADVRITVAWERFTQLLQRRRNLTGRTGCGLCGAESAADAIRECGPVPAGVSVTSAALHAAIGELAGRQPNNASTCRV